MTKPLAVQSTFLRRTFIVLFYIPLAVLVLLTVCWDVRKDFQRWFSTHFDYLHRSLGQAWKSNTGDGNAL